MSETTVPYSKRSRGDLTEADINQYLPRFMNAINSIAKRWWLKCGKRIEFDGLVSCATEAAWESMLMFRHDGGSTMRTWTLRYVESRLGAYCQTEWRRMKKRWSIRSPWPRTAKGKLMNFEDTSADVQFVSVELNEAAQSLLQLVADNLNEKDMDLFNRYFIGKESATEIGRCFDVSHQAIIFRVQKLMQRIRILIKGRPEFAAFDDSNLIANIELPQPLKRQPKYRRVLVEGKNPKMTPDAYAWVAA